MNRSYVFYAGQAARFFDRTFKAGKPRPKIQTTQIINDKKIGRNEPCPCESGKKYKKCCGGGK